MTGSREITLFTLHTSGVFAQIVICDDAEEWATPFRWWQGGSVSGLTSSSVDFAVKLPRRNNYHHQVRATHCD